MEPGRGQGADFAAFDYPGTASATPSCRPTSSGVAKDSGPVLVELRLALARAGHHGPLGVRLKSALRTQEEKSGTPPIPRRGYSLDGRPSAVPKMRGRFRCLRPL